MPKPIPAAVRQQVVERYEAGETLRQITTELGLPYESGRNIWRVYRQEGRTQSNYAASGRWGIRTSQRVYRGALFLKFLHPTWGAGLIRQVMADKWTDERLPSERTLQRWYHQAGLQPSKVPLQGEKRLGRGRSPHNVWEMDSREGIRLATGQQVTWLLVSDEASGAIVGGDVFPHCPRRPVERR